MVLYWADEAVSPHLLIKVVGHQWYWSYEYSDFEDLDFDSYMVRGEELFIGQFRLLEVDHRVVLPVDTQVSFLVTAADVLHSWAVPSLSAKIDAVPGRLNQLILSSGLPGLFYGQCSEICGANHSFIPICVEVVDKGSFSNWVCRWV